MVVQSFDLSRGGFGFQETKKVSKTSSTSHTRSPIATLTIAIASPSAQLSSILAACSGRLKMMVVTQYEEGEGESSFDVSKDYSNAKLDDLREMLKEQGKIKSGKREELMARLRAPLSLETATMKSLKER